MTDRVRTLTILLDKDIRVDDVETIKSTMLMIRGVRKVENGPVVDHRDWMNRESVRIEMQEKIWKALKE